MLLSQDFGWRHDGSLPATPYGLQCRHHGNDSLAAADIALQQPLHWVGLCQIMADLERYLLLRAGERKRQAFEEGTNEPGRGLEYGGAELTTPGIMLAHG